MVISITVVIQNYEAIIVIIVINLNIQVNLLLVFLTALKGVAELAKGIQYEDPIKTG